MSSDKRLNKARDERMYNPKKDYRSEFCDNRINRMCLIRAKIHGRNYAACNCSHYNKCPLLDGQRTLL